MKLWKMGNFMFYVQFSADWKVLYICRLYNFGIFWQGYRITANTLITNPKKKTNYMLFKQKKWLYVDQ